jgi:hypothetical protein
MSIDREGFIDVRPSTHRTVQDAAARYGIDIHDTAARAIADAVLECADSDHRVTMEITPETWGQPGVRTHVTDCLRRQLAIELMELGMLPTALPREVVTTTYAPWEVTKVEMVVPVRKAPRR